MLKKINIKLHPNPKLKISDFVKVEYVQYEFDTDNRYIVVKKRTENSKWEQIIKFNYSSIGLAKPFIEDLINNISDDEKKNNVSHNLAKFWNKVEQYNDVIDKLEEYHQVLESEEDFEEENK